MTRRTPSRPRGDAAAGSAKRPGLFCPWCGKPPTPNGRRVVLFESETARLVGGTVAQFHVECSEAILALCERRGLADTAAITDIPAPPPPAIAASEPAPEPAPPVADAAPIVPPASAPEPVKAARPPMRRPRGRPPREPPPPPPKPAPDIGDAARDLARRGFTPSMISARLRAPYAAVRAVIDAAGLNSASCVSRGSGA